MEFEELMKLNPDFSKIPDEFVLRMGDFMMGCKKQEIDNGLRITCELKDRDKKIDSWIMEYKFIRK